MPDVLLWILCAVIGYFLGTFTTGSVVAKYIASVDIKKTGSNSAGTTNVLRTLGWGPSLLTLAGDALKGIVAVLIGRFIGGTYGAYLGGIFVVLGHNWPVFSKFRGGKGVAASFGAILALHPLIALILLACQIIVVAITKYMSVASIVSAFVFTALVAATQWGDWLQIGFAAALSALAIFSHRANIGRLINHSENRLDFAKINKLSRKK